SISEAIQSLCASAWIASSRSLSSGAHSRDPLAPRNDDAARLSPQHRDGAIGEGQALGHHSDEIGEQLLAERRVFVPDDLELMRAQDIEDACDLGLNARAAPRMRDQPHFADRRVTAE